MVGVLALQPGSLPGLLALALALAPQDAEPAPQVTVLVVGKVLTMNDAGDVHDPGMLILEDASIRYVGPPTDVPDGARVLEYRSCWATPGLVDLHTHIHAGGFGDINDMVQAVNPELRARPSVVPGNAAVRLGCASGATTLFAIPGSGTNMGGFGLVYKAKVGADSGEQPAYEDVVVRDPGGLKVAQDSNPQRRNGTDFGVSRAGMSWNIADVNDRAISATYEGRFDPALEMLKRVHTGELPVLIHTASSEGVINTARMWRETYPTQSTVSHGSFDGWRTAPAVAAYGMPVNHGPRTVDYFSSREGRIIGTGAEFAAAGVPLFSLNTDSPVVPQEEFFLQGAMSARYGGDPYTMIQALTLNPAKAFALDEIVGSLEVGKDADVVIRTGDPLDPREAVELVLIDGVIEYDRKRDGQLF